MSVELEFPVTVVTSFVAAIIKRPGLVWDTAATPPAFVAIAGNGILTPTQVTACTPFQPTGPLRLLQGFLSAIDPSELIGAGVATFTADSAGNLTLQDYWPNPYLPQVVAFGGGFVR